MSPERYVLYVQIHVNVAQHFITDKPAHSLQPKPPSRTARRGVAVDAVGPGASYTPVKLPTDKLNDYIEVFVSMVTNPGNFCLQLKGPYTTEALEMLMDELE